MIVTFAQPGAAARAMYFGEAPRFNGGHESAGVTAPSTTWSLAEGATGPIAVERAVYWNANGQPWTAGTRDCDAIAVSLEPH